MSPPIAPFSRPLVLFLFLSLLATPGVAPAQALEPIFRDELRGGLILTGNTLGLSGSVEDDGPGTRDSINAFIAHLQPANGPPGWPSGTSLRWQDASSTAPLELPDDAEVLLALLMWGGSYKVNKEDVSAWLDDPVLLHDPSGHLHEISPGPLGRTLSEEAADGRFKARYYLRSAEVTELVRAGGSGRWAVGRVPATSTQRTNMMNAAGWSLLVVYTHADAPMRSIGVFAGAEWVDEFRQGSRAVHVELPGICTPPVGPVSAELVFAALEGDATLDGDQLSVGQGNATEPRVLSGPNNPADNFFASQINGPEGRIDERGSFGSCNHDATRRINHIGCRQGWDLTTLRFDDADTPIGNGWTELRLTASSRRDSYVLLAAGAAVALNGVELNEAVASLEKTADGLVARWQLAREGDAIAEDVRVALHSEGLPSEEPLQLCSSLDDQPMTRRCVETSAEALRSGIELWERLPEGGTPILELRLALPAEAERELLLEPTWSWAFLPCAGQQRHRLERTGTLLRLEARPPSDPVPPEEPPVQDEQEPARDDEPGDGVQQQEPPQNLHGYAVRQRGCSQSVADWRWLPLLLFSALALAWHLLQGPDDWSNRHRRRLQLRRDRTWRAFWLTPLRRLGALLCRLRPQRDKDDEDPRER